MLKQSLQQKLAQKLSPQQIKLMKLIQLPTIELEQKVKEEIEENPAIEEGVEQVEKPEFEDYENREDQRIEANEINVDEYLSDDEVPRYRLVANNTSPDQEEKSIPVAMGVSSTEILEKQLALRSFDDHSYQIGLYLIGCVNDNGYIRREVSAIVDDLAFTQNIITTPEEISEVMEVIQDFEPPGIGARNLQECLEIQLKKKATSEVIEVAREIVSNHFNSLSKKHYDKLLSRLSITQDLLKKALKEISKLNPKPGSALFSSSRIVQHIIPDFRISIVDGQLELSMNTGVIPELRINSAFKNLLQTYKESSGTSQDKTQKDAVLFVKQKLDSAKWFIDAIRQRHRTLMLTMSSIMKFQEEYFISGDERMLKPMILKDIAEKVGMDISTVSRVANSKYVDTPYGTFLIKNFFSESMKNDQGEDVSTKEIKKILEEVIQKEDKTKPLTDAKLMDLLKEKGYPIARRTVAKYREQLSIPVARLRKEI
jgi:RNA polymerase sigma-54 factor